MKYTFLINQAGVVRCGLLGRVDLPALCVLDYLSGWFFLDKAKRAVVDGREYVWLKYEHAVEELPLLLNPHATLRTRKNHLSRLVQSLRDAGLIESVKVGRDLYLRPSDLAAALTSSRERTVTKSAPIITPSHDDTVTPSRGETITANYDDSGSTIIDETTIKEPDTPVAPLQGEADALLTCWNSFPQLPKIQRFTQRRLKALRQRLADDFFRANWRAGIERVARSPFCTGQGDRGWRANLDWFLRPDTLTKIVEGAYDHTGRATTVRPLALPRQFNREDYSQPLDNI